MIRKIFHFFDKLEDHIRFRLSRVPILYALIGGVGVVLFWRGVWLLADDVGLGHVASLVISIIILLLSGTFVWFFIGDQILISGLKAEKRMDEKTEEEIQKEEKEIKSIYQEIRKISKDLDEIKKRLR
ncbi:hypothetical protein D4R52_02305 [bacterium]|nr:MAG: hypothetical protein D4R52_02305 [bacterium]